MSEFITITAIDKHSSESQGKTFKADSRKLKQEIEEWEATLPYRRFELVTSDFLDDDYSEETKEVLKELEIEN